ncbi:MAG: helix-turn-helix transcriptional regulator [Chloroflexota bacterium]
MDWNMVVSIRLKELVKKKGCADVPYRKLAKEMGISHVPLWKMLNGKPYNPSLEMLNRICSYFKCQVGDLLVFKK